MPQTRVIYFSDEAFRKLEEMELYDDKGKKLSRAKKLNFLILDKIEQAKTIDNEHMIEDLTHVIKGLDRIWSLLVMQEYEQAGQICSSLQTLIKEIRSSLK